MKALFPLIGLGLFLASSARAEAPSTVATSLQPFVENHVLAGAVTLVADKDKVLDVTTVGYEDVVRRNAARLG